MSKQNPVESLELFRGVADPAPDAKPKKPEIALRDRWWQFHIRHPAIYLALEKAALGYAKRGEQTGIARLVEDLRYDRRITAGVEAIEPFKINNSYRAFYARLLIDHHPSLAEILETRIQKSGENNA